MLHDYKSMKLLSSLLLGATLLLAGIHSHGAEPVTKLIIPYAQPAHERHVLDIFAPKDAKKLPVVFWIHGGGWQTGDKSDVQLKPQIFTDRGFIFVSTNYRLLPNVDMDTIIRDVAKSLGWVHGHIAGHGGDPQFPQC